MADVRTVNFRDDVLWGIAYKAGYDPLTNFPKNVAYAVATYINSYVRRLWDSADFYEWTPTGKYLVNGTHLVSWDALALDLDRLNPPRLGKPLRVYLLDPATTWSPVDIPFRQNPNGIHVGFDHGPNVWIKFVQRCPRYTAREWDAQVTYNRGDPTYSPFSGECYESKVNGNQGNDPSTVSGGPTTILTTEITQKYLPPDPGAPAQDKIMQVTLTDAVKPPGGDAITPPPSTIPDPPPVGHEFTIEVRNSVDTLLASVTHTASGESLGAIATALKDALALDPDLATFLLSANATFFMVSLQHPSDYRVTATHSAGGDMPDFPMLVSQVQAYIPTRPPVPGIPQKTKLSLPVEQVIPGGIYTVIFRAVDGIEHTIVYTALPTDTNQQILAGLTDAVTTAQSTDPFFLNVGCALDTVGPSLTFTFNNLGTVSTNAEVLPPSSPYWQWIGFPFVLADPVVRGALADLKGEGGQTDKQAADEQLVPVEAQVRVGAQQGKEYDPLTDQQRAHSRYEVK